MTSKAKSASARAQPRRIPPAERVSAIAELLRDGLTQGRFVLDEEKMFRESGI